MSRTTLTVITAAAMSFALDFGGNWITYSLLIGRGLNNKDDFIKISLIEVLVVVPMVSVLIGGSIGWLEERNQGWWAVVSLLPLLGYGFYDSPGGTTLILCLIYLTLAFASALLGARLRRARQTLLKHV